MRSAGIDRDAMQLAEDELKAAIVKMALLVPELPEAHVFLIEALPCKKHGYHLDVSAVGVSVSLRKRDAAKDSGNE